MGDRSIVQGQSLKATYLAGITGRHVSMNRSRASADPFRRRRNVRTGSLLVYVGLGKESDIRPQARQLVLETLHSPCFAAEHSQGSAETTNSAERTV